MSPVENGHATQTDAEREVQKAYWKEHSAQATVESMMLDSKAADIDKMERPEVREKTKTRFVGHFNLDHI